MRQVIMWNLVTVDGFFEGSPNPLFKASAGRSKLKLVEARPMASGCVILPYYPDAE